MARAAGAAEDVDHLRQMRRSRSASMGSDDVVQLKRLIGSSVLITVHPRPGIVLFVTLLEEPCDRGDQGAQREYGKSDLPQKGSVPGKAPADQRQGGKEQDHRYGEVFHGFTSENHQGDRGRPGKHGHRNCPRKRFFQDLSFASRYIGSARPEDGIGRGDRVADGPARALGGKDSRF